MPPKKGTPGWSFHALEKVTGSKDVLAFAWKWIQDHKFSSTPKFGNLVVEGQSAGCQICSCQGHLNCDVQYRFSLRTPEIFEERLDIDHRDGDFFFLVEKKGTTCNVDEPNHARMKKEHTRNLAKLNISPSKVDRVCHERKIPEDSRPDPKAVSNRKFNTRGESDTSTSVPRRFTGDYIATMVNFVKKKSIQTLRSYVISWRSLKTRFLYHSTILAWHRQQPT